MSNNPAILEVVEEYVIPFISYPKESKLPRVIIISKEETKLRDKEIQEMLMKGIISLTKKTEDQLSTLFLMRKKDGGKPSGHQPERVEQTNPSCSFQNTRSR